MTVGREADAAWLMPRAVTRERAGAAARPDVLFGSDQGLATAAAALWLGMSLWKLALAAHIGVVWEEAHFVVAGMHPALAYPDIPAGWPLFARACVALFGWSPLAVRVPSLLVAQAVPFGIYFMAAPVVGRRGAIWAGLLSMLVPALGAGGAIFYSEAAMQLLLALMLGGLIRGMSGGQLGWWVLTGVAAGLGLFVHYRFAGVGLGILGFVLASRPGRRLWREPGFWLAGALAAAGLAPSVLYSLATHAPAISYHLLSQQAWQLNLIGPLAYVAAQAALCTPVFFLGMAAGSVRAFRRAQVGDEASTLLLWVGGVLFGAYALLSPLDQKLAPQWPIEAYVPLIAFLPGALAAYVDSARSEVHRRLRMALVGTGPVMVGVLFVLASLWTAVGWAHPDRVALSIRDRITTDYEPFAQFEPAIARAQVLARQRFGAEPLLATAGHVEAVKLEFPGQPGRQVFALGDPREMTAHFDIFRAAIHLDRRALLAEHAGAAVVILLPEPTYLYDTPAETQFRTELCNSFSDIAPVETVEASPGRLVMQTFTARVGGAAPAIARPCPFLPRIYVSRPKRTDILNPDTLKNLSGLAASPGGVARVDILLDGRAVSQGRLHQTWPGAPATSPTLAYDPDYPKLRFTFELPKAALTPGAHRLAIRVTGRDGSRTVGEDRTIYAP